jgi:NAD(P)-dependent dehydrogenase (short-subunit alcohol dehydrogenase family)
VSVAEWLSITHHDDGIVVNLICPQAVNTPFIGDVSSSDSSDSSDSQVSSDSKKNAGGAAGVDGVIQPADVAASLIEAMEAGRFLVLPHPQVHRYMQNKARFVFCLYLFVCLTH